jgi:hypothetical protein
MDLTVASPDSEPPGSDTLGIIRDRLTILLPGQGGTIGGAIPGGGGGGCAMPPDAVQLRTLPFPLLAALQLMVITALPSNE